MNDGQVFVGGPDALFALSAESGDILWRYEVGKMVGSSPVLSVGGNETRLFVGAEDGFAYSFSV